MPEPKDLVIAALKDMLAKVGPDAEFSADAIWDYAGQAVAPLRKPPLFRMLSSDGYIEDTGEKTNPVTQGRRSAPTIKYRFGPRLRPRVPTDPVILANLPDVLHSDCKGILQTSRLQCARLCASLLSKRFLILTGLSGSGKTKLAQALARWITPPAIVADPFKPGAKIESDHVTYYVKASDELAVEFWNTENENETIRVTLPRAMILEWARFITNSAVPKETPAREIREAVKPSSRFSPQLHSFETHLKAAAFAWIQSVSAAEPAKCYEVVPVGADWTGSENVLGYPSGLDKTTYVSKPTLNLIIHALAHPDTPHFLILDEMNLSHVERYFADLLSAIESEETLALYCDDNGPDGKPKNTRGVEPTLALPPNLFIIGTVNVDETTYMFSPKVLDRANVIEFRVEAADLQEFIASPAKPELSKLDGKGAAFGKAFVDVAKDPAGMPPDVKEAYETEMLLFFNAMRLHGAEFGYRVAHESARLIHFNKLLGKYPDDTPWFAGAFDCVILQKFLPKLHGSRAKLGPLLRTLWFLCVTETAARGADPLKAAQESARSTEKRAEPSPILPAGAPYPLSADKISRMWRLLNENGFASFAEA
jgi:hypothetical protein